MLISVNLEEKQDNIFFKRDKRDPFPDAFALAITQVFPCTILNCHLFFRMSQRIRLPIAVTIQHKCTREKTRRRKDEEEKKKKIEQEKHFPLDRRIGGAEAHFPVHLIIFYVRFMIMHWEYEEPKAGQKRVKESVIASSHNKRSHTHTRP